jgi:hypothetical protein
MLHFRGREEVPVELCSIPDLIPIPPLLRESNGVLLHPWLCSTTMFM